MSAPHIESPAKLTPLAEAELDELGRLLGADWAPETTMDLEQLDGFLAGLVCAPRLVSPLEHVAEVFGADDVRFPDDATAQRFHELLLRRHAEVLAALDAPIERLDDPRAYVPLLLDWQGEGDLPLRGELWARGFLHAVDRMRDDWDALPEGDDEAAQLVDDALDAIAALVPEEGEPAGSEDERDGRIAEALLATYDLRDTGREVQFEQIRVKEPIRREPKVGRNEPCPCGSGRKFKHCHGREH